MQNKKSSLYIALFVAFIDYMGVGLIYPLFSSMLFDCTHCLVSPDTSNETRGILLGLLLALMPLTQFFAAPIWGAVSDSKGRKKPLQMSLVVGCLGYLTAFSGVALNSVALLLVSRFIIGFAAGNMSIVQATVADVSLPETKAKNFGLYCMALGLGFTLGPFFGGALSSWGYMVPFIFALLITTLNLAFAFLFFKETHTRIFKRTLSWTMGITHLKKAFQFKGVRVILLASFLHNFAWSYFFEFIPVYLIYRFRFSSLELGFFYGVAGGFYALSTGLLIRPFVKRLKPETLFFMGNLLTALTIGSTLFLPSAYWIWPFLILMAFFVAFVTPSATTIISDNANSQSQGEALGVLSSVNAAALVLSPIVSGTLVGRYPTLPMWVGGAVMLLAALLVLSFFRGKLFR